MGMESLIPFGLDSASGRLVDAGSVKRGNACGCVCPSCKTPLVAKHGDEREWHFAHRSRNVHRETRKACEYSFAVSVRLMIRQLSLDGLNFRTPRLIGRLPLSSAYPYASEVPGYVVTEESLLKLESVQVGAHFCGVTVDVLGLVQGIPFVVFVTYKERSVPIELISPSVKKSGVVEINLSAVAGLFRKVSKGRYVEALRRYIEEDIDGKGWIYHPREKELRDAAMQRHEEVVKRRKLEIRVPTHRHRSRKLPPVSTVRIRENNYIPPLSPQYYACVMCGGTWEGASRKCPNCDTHLYTTERK
jgi:rubrerythrin